MAKHLVLGMGNPLLDFSAVVKPEFLAKYNLKSNDAILYDKEDIFEELKADYPVEYIAGGATQNSIRTAQWILGDSGKTAYFGCVGKDDAAQILKDRAAHDGVDARYQESSEYPTGKCAVLITGQDRSLVTNLEAANHFTVDHLDAADNWAVVEECKVYYSAGFFLTVCPAAMVRVAKYASENGKYFAFNLSAPFIPEFFKDPLMEVLPYANLVFGNESEADVFARVNNWETTDRKEIAKKISEMPLVGHKSRIVIITQGADDVIMVDETGKVSEIPICKVSKEEIVDTNGAGDAFVGGFIAQLALGKSIDECVKCGIWSATEIIQRSGCTFPNKKF